MEITFEHYAKSLSKVKLNALILFLPENAELDELESNELPKTLKKNIQQAITLKAFTGKVGSTQLLFPASATISHTLLVGLGPLEKLMENSFAALLEK